MKKVLYVFLAAVMAVPILAVNGFTAQQSIPPSASLSVDGQNEGVVITAPATLTVNGVGGFTDIGLTAGSSVSTNAINQGVVLFNVSSTAAGSIGAVVNTVDQVNATDGATTVNFNGTVFTRLMGVGTGTVNLNSGTLGAAGNKGAVTFTGDGTINVAQNTSFTGALSDAGAQTGTLNLLGAGAGVDQWIGQVGVAGMRSINVASGAVAGLTSQITGNVDTYAFQLGNNTLNIIGALNLRTGPAGAIYTTLSSSSLYGRIVETGANTFTGGVVNVNVTVPSGTVIPVGTQFDIVDDAGAGQGGVPIVVTATNPLYTFTAPPTVAGRVRLQLAGTPLTSSALPQASVLNNIPNPSADLNQVVGAINSISDPGMLNAAVGQLSPISNGGMSQGGFDAVNQSISALTTHLGEAGNNAGVGGRDEGISTGDFWADNGIWMKGFGNSTEQSTHKGVTGYDSSMWGVIVGIDGVYSDDMLLGFAGGYESTGVDGKADTSNTDIDSYYGTMYISKDDPGPWYGDAGLAFTWNSYDTNRHIVLPGVDRTAVSSPDGQVYTAFGDVGYVIPINEKWNVTPIAALTYSHLEIGKYTESGAGDLNLSVGGQDYDMLQSALGAKVDATVKNTSGTWVPEAHVRWLYDFIGDQVATTSTFAGGGAAFDTRGLKPEQSVYNVGLGMTFYSKGNISITGTYDYLFADDYASHAGQATVRYTF